jgi:hypothetical protein
MLHSETIGHVHFMLRLRVRETKELVHGSVFCGYCPFSESG